MPGGQLREAGGGRAGGGLVEPLEQRGGGAVVGGRLAGVAGPGQLGAVGLDAHAEGIERRGIARVGLNQGHGLGHQLPGLSGVAAPQRQLGQAGEQRAGQLGLGDRGGKQPPDGAQPCLGGVEVAAAQLQRGPREQQRGPRPHRMRRSPGPRGRHCSAWSQRPRAISASVAL